MGQQISAHKNSAWQILLSEAHPQRFSEAVHLSALPAGLALYLVKRERGNGGPKQQQYPKPAFQQIVVMEEPTPGMPHDVMAKDKLKPDSESQPYPTYRERLS